ncbi:MAG TPA: acyloxyacyl hydrolase [Terriglobales bacterium]|nr:acyloxyacyl hydrolase [Terriglobales bacterium]
MRIAAVVLMLLIVNPWARGQKPAESPLRQPVWEFGPWFGGGTGLGTASEFKFINAGARIGRVLSNEIGTGRFRGTFEWAADLMPLYEVQQSLFYTSGPSEWIYGGAFNPIVLKWNWTANPRIVPHFEAEGGVLFTTKEVPPGDTSRVNFLPGGAFGIYLMRASRQAIDLSVHVTHISNASMGDHNPGINATMQFRLGYTWFK